MIDALVRAAVHHRALVLAGALALVVVGATRANEMPVDVFPDVSSPRVAILTEAPGLAPVEVEELVTLPIESAVNGTAGTRQMRSASSAGLSIVWVDFDWDTPGWLARQRITERLTAAVLPPESEAPYLAPESTVMAEICFLALTGEGVDPMDLRRVAEVDVRRRLLATEGVAEVTTIGGYEREYQVLLDDERLGAFELTIADVTAAIAEGSRNAAGGYLVERGTESVVRVLGRAEHEAHLGDITLVERDGVGIRVRDVAEVRVGRAVRRGAGGYDGEDAVVLGVLKQPNTDTLEVTAAVDDALEELEPLLARRGIEVQRESFRQATFIHRATENLFDVLRDGAILVALVLVFFLWNPGATLVSVLSLPLSLLGGVLLLDLLGFGFDVMTLGGMAIAVGELVDDAIVDVENVVRRLRERRSLPEAERPGLLATVVSASIEVRSAIVSATFVIALVFVPLLFLGGFEGRLLRPLATAYLVAIGASLLVALTVTPVLASYLCRGTRDSEPPVQRRVVGAYERVLRFAMPRPWLWVAVVFGLVVAGGVGVATAARGFLPEMNEGSAIVTLVGMPGTSIDDGDALGRRAEELLLEAGVVSTTRRTGRATHDEHVLGPETTEIEVLFAPDDPRDKDERFDDLREALEAVPGNVVLGQPLGHRVDHMLHGQKTALSVRVVGEDLVQLRRVAERVRARIAAIDGVVDAAVEPIVNVPNLEVDVVAADAARHGLSRGEAATAIGVAVWGAEVGRVFEDATSTPIVVRYPDALRSDRRRLASARIPTEHGALVPIDALAELRDARSPNYVMREAARRRVSVTANLEGSDLVRVAREVREATAELELPGGVHLEHAGRFAQQQAASERLTWLGLLALLGIALVVAVTLRSARRAVIVLLNLPLALAGGVIGVHLAGAMSIATTVGFITLFGIATRNGLLLATRAGELEREGVPRDEAVASGAKERVMPVLMTAITAGLGLLPLAMALGDPGAEIQAPMALVILTGLLTSTALNLLVVPSLLARFGGDLRAGLQGVVPTPASQE